ncbi:hypothetical protein ACFX2I_001251 [Malus domestica]
MLRFHHLLITRRRILMVILGGWRYQIMYYVAQGERVLKTKIVKALGKRLSRMNTVKTVRVLGNSLSKIGLLFSCQAPKQLMLLGNSLSSMMQSIGRSLLNPNPYPLSLAQ